MNILILGGHGFIGHHTAKVLSDQGHSITVVDRHHTYGDYPEWEYNPIIEQRLIYMPAHQFLFGDVTDLEFMQAVFAAQSFDVVIDLATYPNAKMVKRNVIDATENMITATAIAIATVKVRPRGFWLGRYWRLVDLWCSNSPLASERTAWP